MNTTARFLFPNISSESVIDRVKMRWDLSGPLPVPMWDVKCPICGALMSNDGIQAREWRFREQPTSTNPYRCDVALKCTECSYMWRHGLVITEVMYKQQECQVVTWWQARKIFAAAQNGS